MNDHRAPAHPDLTTVVIERQDLDLIRVEKSLHSLGFFASTRREMSRTVVQVIRRADGQRIQAKAVIEGIPSLGLPTTADRDKYMAFMKIALDQRDMEGQLTNPVHFTGADMIKLLGLRKGGFHYDEINDWCKRMVATTIMSESSIFLADRRQYVSDTFHVFDRVVLLGEELNENTRSDCYLVYLSHWQLNNLNQGYILPLDFKAYLRLRRDIAKALFGHLSIWFFASRGQVVEKRYQDLCQLLNICAYPHLSKARSVLQPSLQELTEIGYLSEWDLVRTTRGGDFKLVLCPGNRLLSLPNLAPVVRPDAKAALDSSLPTWVAEIVRRGVTDRKARQLALDVPEAQPVADQLEYADYLIAQDRRGRGKIDNPAGFYIWVIEENLSVPEGFETSTRRRERELREQTERSQQAIAAEQRYEYELYCREMLKQKLEKDLAGELAESAIREQFKLLKRQQPEWFARVPESTRREVALSHLETKIRESMDLPSFEQWAKRTGPQLRMF